MSVQMAGLSCRCLENLVGETQGNRLIQPGWKQNTWHDRAGEFITSVLEGFNPAGFSVLPGRELLSSSRGPGKRVGTL